MPTFTLIAAVAVAIFTILGAMLLMITIAIQREDRRAHGLRDPAPGLLTRTTRRVTGLHVCQAQPLARLPQQVDPWPGRSPGRR